MDDQLSKLRKLAEQLQKLTLKHIHNALEFADLREGAPYAVEFERKVVSPLAHFAMHAAAKGQIEECLGAH